MKKILLSFIVVALAALAFTACNKKESGGGFDAANLYSGSGEWESTQLINGVQHEIHDKFLADGTGSSWSVTDASLPQPFTWELVGNRLTFLHNIEMGGVVPKEYTVKTLTEYSLVYTDEWGNTTTCSKVRGVE